MKTLGFFLNSLSNEFGILFFFSSLFSLSVNAGGSLTSKFHFPPAVEQLRRSPAPLGSGVASMSEIHIRIDRVIQEISDFRFDLDKAQADGTSGIMFKALSEDYDKKLEDLIEYLETYGLMTREQLIERVRQEIKKKQVETEQVDDNQVKNQKDAEARLKEIQTVEMKKSVIDGMRAIFHRIEPKSFKMGETGKKVDVTLTKPFEMMATPTTQIIWRKVAELAEQRFQGQYNLNPNPSKFQGDTHPVENVSFHDIQVWIKALNSLSEAGEPALDDLIPGHQKGDTYRLPTEAEWEFVIRGRGQYNDIYYFGNQKSQLGEYAWVAENSKDKTHPVAEKKALIVDGKEFFDMIGNVWEWVQDWFRTELPGGFDPLATHGGLSLRVARGGDMNSNPISSSRHCAAPDTRSYIVGFRLAKNVRGGVSP